MPVYKDNKRNTWYIATRKRNIQGDLKYIKKRGFQTKKEAQFAEASLLLNNDVSFNISFKELYLDYLEHQKNNVKTRTLLTFTNRFEKHVLPYFENKKIKDITLKNYQEWKKIINNKNYTNNYKKGIHTNIVSLFNYGIRFHNLKTNIPSIVGGFKDTEIKKELLFWTYEEFKQFINVVDDNTYYCFFNSLYYTGMRLGETLALNWNDIDFEKGEIKINKSISRRVKGKDYTITSPKTKSSNRTVLMPKELLNIYNKYFQEQKQIKGFELQWFVFGGFRPLPETSIARNKDKYCEISGVKKIRIHDFRHSHASLLINKGANVTIIAQRLGHSDIAMTLNTYSHMFPNSQKEIVHLIDNI